MNDKQKEAFTKAIKAIARNLNMDARDRTINVDKIEAYATELVSSLVMAYKEHSTQYTIKIKDKVNLWFDEELTRERQEY